MKKKSSDIYNSLLATAREEFLEKGFNDTSMRTIAQKADVGLSNIYNYFQNKDAIFRKVLQPVIDALERLNEDHYKESHLNINMFTSREALEEQTRVYVDIIMKYKDELNILLHKSHGSALENYKEDFINRHTVTALDYMRLLKKKYPHINIDVSEFFIHILSSWWIGIMGELVMHDLSRNELERFMAEYLQFFFAGWKNIIRIE